MKRFQLPALVLSCVLVICQAQLAEAKRPTAPQLFPYNTVVYVRVHDLPQLKLDFQQTSVGAIRNDESVAPLIDRLYSELLNAFPQLEDELGVTVEDLLELPTGEVAFSLAVTDTARPMVAFVADVGANTETADKLIERAEFEHISNAGSLLEETIGETEVTIFQNPGDDDDLYIFIKEETVVICSSELMATHLISVWEETALETDRTLSDNRKFTDIMRNSVGADNFQPQISFFADPLTLINATTQGNFEAQAALAILPTIGVDGFKAVGGSFILAPPGFDSIGHFHLALGTPRRGVLNLLTFDHGDMTPEPWVPANAADYSTVYWDLEKTYDEAEKLVDQILGAGYFSNLVEENINTSLGLDLREDIISQIAGRVSQFGAVVEPVRLNSMSRLVAVKLTDPASFTELMDEQLAKYEQALEKKEYNGTTYYLVAAGGPRDQSVEIGSNQPPGTQPRDNNQPGQNFAETFRRPQPSFAVVGGYLVAADSLELIQSAIDTHDGNGDRLADENDFKLIAAEIQNQTGEIEPSAISFSRPAEALKMFYDLLNGEQAQQALQGQAENNQFFRVINSAFQDNPLPDYSVISQHLAPQGGVLFDRPTGLHYMTFSLKPESTK